MPKLPKTIYVAWTELGKNEPPFLEAVQDWADFGKVSEKRQVGMYVLQEITSVEVGPIIRGLA